MAQRRYTMEDLASPLDLWRWISGLTLAAMTLDLALAAQCGGELLFGRDYLYGKIALAGLAILSRVAMAGVAVTLVVFVCRFCYRAMRNLHILNPPVTLVSPAWAAGWLFAPVANLVMPFRVVRQMQRGVEALDGKQLASTDSTGPWWGLWLLFLAVAGIALALTFRAIESGRHDPDLTRPALFAGATAALAHFLCALFFLDVFGRLARAQHALVSRYAPTP